MISRSNLISALLFTVANGAFGAIPIVLMPWLTRVLTPAEYGLVAMFSVLVQLFSALTGLSVQGAISVRFFDREKLLFSRYVASCLAVLAGSTMLTLALVVAVMPTVQDITMLPATWIILAVVVSCLQFVIQVQLAIWQAERSAPKYAGLRLGQVAIDILGSVSLILLMGYAWEARPIGIAIASLLTASWALYRLFKNDWAAFPIQRDYVSDALRFGVPLVPHALGGMLISLADRFLITNLIGVAEAGIYTVSVQMGLVVLLVADGINRTVSPWLFENLKQNSLRIKVQIVKGIYTFFALMLAGGVIGGLVAYYALPLLAGPAFSAAASFMPIIALAQAIGGMYYMVSNLVFYARATSRLAIITLSSGLLNTGLSFVLISNIGVSGAPFAFLAAQMLLFGGTWWLAARVIPLPWLFWRIRPQR